MKVLTIRNKMSYGATRESISRAKEYYARADKKLAEKIKEERELAGLTEIPQPSKHTVFADKFTRQIKLELLDKKIAQYEDMGNSDLANTFSIVRSLIEPASYQEKVSSLNFPKSYS